MQSSLSVSKRFKYILMPLLFSIFLLIAVFSSHVFAVDSCAFESEVSKQQQTISDQRALSQLWLPETQEVKGVLKTGQFINIQYWTCHNYGLQADLLYKQLPADIDLHAQTQLLAELALSPENQQLLVESLKDAEIKPGDLPYSLHIDESQNFMLSIESLDEYILIRLSQYQS